MTDRINRLLFNGLLVVLVCVLMAFCCHQGYVAMGKTLEIREREHADYCRAFPAACDLPQPRNPH